MSKFLGIDTSSRYLTVVAEMEGRVALRHLPDCAMRHSVILMDEIDSALKDVDLSPAECDFFAAVTGPGSFTGIRIGIATAKGFAIACGKPVLGVTAFDMIAYNVADENFCVAIDAARSRYYVCGYCAGKKISLAPCYLSVEEVKSLCLPVYGFEDLPFENYKKLSAKDCLLPAIRLKQGDISWDIRALYVRKSQAEEARGGA